MIICSECGNAAPSRDGFCSSCGALLEWAGEKVEVRGATGTENGTGNGVVRPPGKEATRPDPTPLTVEPEYSGPFCWSCGSRNPEDRTFCRTCGQPLALTVSPMPKLSWWRRLLARLRRRRGHVAGDRPAGFRRHDAMPSSGGRGLPDMPNVKMPKRRKFRIPRRIHLSRVAPLLIILGALGASLGPARSWVTDHVFNAAHKAEQRLHEQYVPDAPTGATASSALPGHAAGLAVDGVSNTYWAAAAKNDGVGATLTVHFATPVDISRIGIMSGEPGAAYRSQPRPRTLTVTAAGDAPAQLTFVDTADFQNQAVKLHHVSTLTITFTGVYPGQGGHDLAVREIQFFTLQ